MFTSPETKVDEAKLFEDMFKGMPFEQAKEVILQVVRDSKDYDKLAKSCFNGWRMAQLNCPKG